MDLKHKTSPTGQSGLQSEKLTVFYEPGPTAGAWSRFADCGDAHSDRTQQEGSRHEDIGSAERTMGGAKRVGPAGEILGALYVEMHEEGRLHPSLWPFSRISGRPPAQHPRGSENKATNTEQLFVSGSLWLQGTETSGHPKMGGFAAKTE